jgi:hypothetical protein
MKTLLLSLLFITLRLHVCGQQITEDARAQADSLVADENEKTTTLSPENCVTPTNKINPAQFRFDENDIVYDVKTKQIFQVQDARWVAVDNLKKVRNVRYNQKLRLRVINVNRYNYNVGLTANDVLHVSDKAPAVFDELFLGGGDSAVQKLLATAVSAMAAAAVANDDSTLKKLVDDYNRLRISYDTMLQDWIDAYNYCLPEALPCCTIKNLDADVFTVFSSEVREVKETYYAAIKNVQGNIKGHDATIKGAEASIAVEKGKIADLEKEKLDPKTKPVRLAQISVDIKNHESRIRAFEKTIAEQETFKVGVEEDKKRIEKIGEFLFSLSETKLLRLAFHKKNRLYNHLIYTSPPIYPTGNSVKIGIQLTPRDSSLVVKWNGYPLENDSLGFELPVSGRLNFSFSSGPFVGLNKAFRKEEYFWQAQPDAAGLVQDSTQYKLLSRGQNAMPIGLAGFANAIYKIKQNFGLGGSVGAGLTLEKKSRPAYFLGATMQIGHLQQLNLTFGAALMRSEKLDQNLYPDATYKVRPANPEYRSTNEYGFFFSVSYSIFNMSEKKNTKSK